YAAIDTRLLMGIILHKSSETLALVSTLKSIINNKYLVFWYLLFFSFASPFGLWVSRYFGQTNIFNEKFFVALAAIAVGNLLHISTTIFSESNHNHRISLQKLSAIGLGIGIVI